MFITCRALLPRCVSAATIKFIVEDMLPGTWVQLPIGDCYDDLTTHDLSFVVGIRVVFASTIVKNILPVADRFLDQMVLTLPASVRSRHAGPVSLSLIKTLAVICMALTKTNLVLDSTFPYDAFHIAMNRDDGSAFGYIDP